MKLYLRKLLYLIGRIPITKIKTGCSLSNIAVDGKDNTIYVIAENEQNAYELSCLSLN